MTFKIGTEYHIVELNRAVPAEVLEWVRERFGDGSDGRWSCFMDKIYFANPNDHVLFILKWS